MAQLLLKLKSMRILIFTCILIQSFCSCDVPASQCAKILKNIGINKTKVTEFTQISDENIRSVLTPGNVINLNDLSSVNVSRFLLAIQNEGVYVDFIFKNHGVPFSSRIY